MRCAEPRNTDTRGSPARVGGPHPGGRRQSRQAAGADLGVGPARATPIVEADSGVAALRCVTAQDFAVILLDVRMPIMDGIETAALIRRRRQSEMTPIIFITAHAGDEAMDIDRYAAGAVDFIFAPVVPEELRAKVSVFANLFSKAAVPGRTGPGGASVGRPAATVSPTPHPSASSRPTPRTGTSTRIPRWTEITGTSADEAPGGDWDTIIDPDHGSDAGARMRRRTTTIKPSCSRRFEIRRPGRRAARSCW